MFCPQCNNRIPDGSNICPLCYANLAGVKPQTSAKSAAEPRQSSAGKSKKAAYTKGSRGKKSQDRTPLIIAFGLVLILVIIIAMIFRSMFGGVPSGVGNNAGTQQQAQVQQPATPGPNFVVFGATPVPTQKPAAPQATATPQIEVTATPAPQAPVTYQTLRKGDQGPEVVTLQAALVELGYLNGATDGNFGTGTQTAVRKFQEENGLDADGIAGKMTQEALFAKTSVTPIPDTTVAPGDIMNLPG